jgi:aspartyl-tRNA(Asn)/glutamyl-tRNA(Gln) amidotransferase subunit C
MNLDKNIISKIAHLSKLELDAEGEKAMQKNFDKILGWMDKLNEVNTDHVEPLIHMSEEVNILREDEGYNALSHEEALKNAPKKDSDYFRVPKFLS